ncbi:hypothetical protein L6164_026011 [Bauhinia variegata]|uniref:Uncharacterized protein n=1 Tax=Bauhinia variegata TaxID=167791 RepID=A0ACB9M3X5_BAUVA|nr:hypothetical protein L6164_026011 [Bauhinia variegata]
MASSSRTSGGVLPHGKFSEIFRYNSAFVMQLSYDDETKHWLKAEGYFVVTLIIEMTYSILVTVCEVDGFKWPLTKDSAIIRMAERAFAIALPGLFYGLCFPPSCREDIIESLVGVFMEYGHYVDLKILVTGKILFNFTLLGLFNFPYSRAYPLLDNQPNFWKIVRRQVQPLAHDILRGFGLFPGRSRFCVPNEDSSLLRAIRMSAVTKLIENAISFGIFSFTDIIISPNQQQFNGSSNRFILDIAYASVTGFTYVVDTIEVSWFMSKGFGSLLNLLLPPLHVWPYPEIKFWRLDDHGLVVIVQQMGTSDEKGTNVMEQGKENENEREMAIVAARDKGKEIIVVDSGEDE